MMDDVLLRFVCLTALLSAQPIYAIESEKDAQITLFKIVPNDEDGVYKYAFSTSNGIKVQAAGSALEAIGIYSYVAPDSTPIELRYVADELGFHAVGRHIPTPPPIPDYILRSLEYIKNHPNAMDRGRYRIHK